MPNVFLRNEEQIVSKSRSKRLQEKEKQEVIAGLLETYTKDDNLPVTSTEDTESLQIKFENLQKEYNDLKVLVEKKDEEITALKLKLKNFEDLAMDQENVRKHALGLRFTENQINLIMKKNKIVRWTPEELSHAFSMRYFSKRAYVYLRTVLKYPLPGVSTLQRWGSKINMRKGILTDILRFMKLFGESLNEFEKLTVLSFDEMKVCSLYEYDRSEDEVVGPHSYMHVIMARGLFSKWKQVIYVDFDKKMCRNILDTVITKLQNIEYNVVAIVSDCGGGNVGLWKELEVTTDKVYFESPACGNKIYVFPDAPHLLKLTRNWLLDTGFILEDGTIISKAPLEYLVNATNTEINSCHKLRNKHLTCKTIERQNVTLAAQLLSHTTATALNHYKPGPCPKLASDLSRFIELCNSWFDIMNSFTTNVNAPTKKPYGLDLKHQNDKLDETIAFFQSMRCNGKKCLQTFQKGVVISCKAIKQLFSDLKEKYKMKYILTHRLNQDVLENFFSQVSSSSSSSSSISHVIFDLI